MARQIYVNENDYQHGNKNSGFYEERTKRACQAKNIGSSCLCRASQWVYRGNILKAAHGFLKNREVDSRIVHRTKYGASAKFQGKFTHQDQ
jgi:hypothetical protein